MRVELKSNANIEGLVYLDSIVLPSLGLEVEDQNPKSQEQAMNIYNLLLQKVQK